MTRRIWAVSDGQTDLLLRPSVIMLEDALTDARAILREAIRGNAPGDYHADVIERDDDGEVVESHTITETL